MVICDGWSKSWVLTAGRLDPTATSRLRLMTLRYWGLSLQWAWLLLQWAWKSLQRDFHLPQRVVTALWQCDVWCQWWIIVLIVNVCLVWIDSYDDVMYVVRVGTLAQVYTCNILMKAWAVIWRQSTGSYVKWIDWLQHQDVRLLEIGWHDRQGQHGWVIK